MYFTADDEADASKARVSKEMRERLGVFHNPLDAYMGRVRPSVSSGAAWLRHGMVYGLDVKSAVHVPVFPEGRLHPVPHPGRSGRQLASV
jgi:hypothetical protein